MHCQADPPRRTHEVTAERLRHFIASQRLYPGMRLPSEYKLATALSTSRPTLREGLLALEISGEIEIMRGAGAFVRDPLKPFLIDTTDDPGPMQFLDARRTVECRIAAEAATAAGPADILVLEHALCQMRSSDAPYWDRKFHLALAEATGKPILSSIVAGLIHPLSHAGVVASSYETADHERIFEAVCQHNSVGAAIEMRRHLNHTRDQLLGHTESRDTDVVC